jgi:hypothetical protein
VTKLERSIIERIIPLIEEYPSKVPIESWGYDPNSPKVSFHSIREILGNRNLVPVPELSLALAELNPKGLSSDLTRVKALTHDILSCVERAVGGDGGKYPRMLFAQKRKLISLLREACQE